MNTYKAYDAIGNEIIIGQRYGFTRNDNGINNVTVGTAAEVTNENKVRLVDVQRKTFVYQSVNSSEFIDVSNTTMPMFSFRLLPIVNKETILLLNMKS